MAKIYFTKSDLSIDFAGDHESILEAAEAAGLDLDFGCRMGNCTACQQPIQSGQVSYPQGHTGEPEPGNALLCCCLPETDLVIEA